MKTSFCPRSSTGRRQAKKAAQPHNLANSRTEGMTARGVEKEPQRPADRDETGNTQATGSGCPTGRPHCSAPEIAERRALLSSFHGRAPQASSHRSPLCTGDGAEGAKPAPSARGAPRAEPHRRKRTQDASSAEPRAWLGRRTGRAGRRREATPWGSREAARLPLPRALCRPWGPKAGLHAAATAESPTALAARTARAGGPSPAPGKAQT